MPIALAASEVRLYVLAPRCDGLVTGLDALVPLFEFDVAHSPVDVARLPQQFDLRPLTLRECLLVLVVGHAHHHAAAAAALLFEQSLDGKWDAVVLLECAAQVPIFEKLVAQPLEDVGLHKTLMPVLVREIESHIHASRPCARV